MKQAYRHVSILFDLTSQSGAAFAGERRFSKSRGLLACVAWRFWLGALSNKGGRGQRNREEIEARSRALRRSCGLLDKTAMLRRLGVCLQAFPSFPSPFPLFHFLALFISRAVKTENPVPWFFCSETKRKRLLRRLANVPQSTLLLN